MIKIKTLFESIHKLHGTPIVSVQEYPTLQGKLKFSVTWIKNYNLIIKDPKRLNYSPSNPKHNTLRPIESDIHSMNKTHESAMAIAKILENEIVEFFKFEKSFLEMFKFKNHFQNDNLQPLESNQIFNSPPITERITESKDSREGIDGESNI